MTILIQSRPSNGARTLREALREEAECLLRRRSATSIPRDSSMLVNWGCSSGAAPPDLNSYESVGISVNKLTAFEEMGLAGVRIPLFTAGRTMSGSVTNDTGKTWFKRTLTRGHGGRGIVVVKPGEEWGRPAPLYVQLVEGRLEFRVHVFLEGDTAHCLPRQKLGVRGFGRTPEQNIIRNTSNGWVLGLVRDSTAAERAEEQAVAAVAALGLDFGAVDVIIEESSGEAFVLEVNTAPGLEAKPVIDFYKTNILNYYRSDQWQRR